MLNPYISVIIPSYNCGHFVSTAINSVLMQSYSNFEIIVIDDGSTDNTKSIVLKFMESDSRVFYYYQDNQKLGKARNAGIEKSRGDLIAFLDADDAWHPDKLHKSIACFDDTIDVLFTSFYYFYEDVQLLNENILRLKCLKNKIYKGQSGLKEFIGGNPVQVPTVLVRRSVLESLNGFKEYGGVEDYDLWIRALLKGHILKSVDLPFSYYRLHSSSMSAKDSNLTLKVINLFEEYLRESIIVKEYFEVELRTWVFMGILKSKSKEEVMRYLFFWEKHFGYNYAKVYNYISFLSFNVTKKVLAHILYRLSI